MQIGSVNVTKLGNSFKLKNGLTIFLDPYAVYDQEKADIILISHDHVDSCSKVDVEKLVKKDTIIVGTQSCAHKLDMNISVVKPGDELEYFGVKIKVVHAYNPDVSKRYHVKGNGVGYKLMLSNTVVYFAGHTDFIPEMRELGKVDVAIIPLGHDEVMDVDDCVEACNVIKADFIVPFYYNDDDADSFSEKNVNGKVVIL